MFAKTSVTGSCLSEFRATSGIQRAVRSSAQKKEPGLGSGVVSSHLHTHNPLGGDTEMDRLVVADADPYSARVADYMSTPVRHLTMDMELASPIVHESLTKFTGLPVVRAADNEVVGILSARDLTKYTNLHGLKVKDAMSYPAIVCTERTSIAAAAGLMLKNKVHRLPVVDSATREKLVGIVTRSDIFTPLLSTEEDLDTPGEVKERELHVGRLPFAEDKYEEYDDSIGDDSTEWDQDAVRW